MKMPVWRRYAVRTPTLRLTRGALGAFAGVLAFLSLAGGVVGYAVGARSGSVHGAVASAPVRSSSGASPADQAAQMKLMNAQMADMQAKLLRLDALGQHLAESANLRGQEFNFSAGKPSGGPLVSDFSPVSATPDATLRLKEMASEIDRREAQLEALDSLLSGRKAEDSRGYLANLPVRRGDITSTFGYRTDPFTGRTAFHPGIDFAGAEGTDIYAVAPGVVSYSGQRTGYGNVVEIDHGGGYMTRYGHVSALLVRAGDRVAKDQLVAYMGSTGRSTGPHLHYEVLLNDRQVDPAGFVMAALRNK